MTPNISRSTFTADLRGVEIPVDQLPNDVQRVLEANRIDRATLERLAGSDRVLRGEEIGQLYDEIRARNRGTPRSGNIDSVTQVYNALKSHAPQVDAISGASPIRPGLRAEVRDGPRRPGRTEDGSPTPVDDPAQQPEQPQGPSNHDRTLQIAALPPATEGNHRAVRTYLDALTAREQGQRKPRGIDENTWALTRALGIEGITTGDVEQYLATGTLPEGKMEQLEQRATRQGSWTATNSLTFLVNARRSAMAAERLAMTAHMNTLAADDPMRLEVQGAINASVSLDRDLGRGLQGIYRARTIAAEQSGQAALRNAGLLEQQALRAREAGDTRKADRLTQQAQAARNRAARIGQSEGDYRSGMHFRGAGNVYRIAAQAQIETGTLRVAAMRDTYGPIQDQPPPELTNDDGTHTSNKVRGAGLLLDQAGTVDGDNGANHASLGLQTARHGALAQFHQIHVERSGYMQRVGANGAPPPARTQFANDQRQAYLDSRAAQSSAIMQRIGLYGPVQNLNSEDALTVGRLQSENATINQEFNAVLGTSLMSDRQVTQQQGLVTQLETGATSARKGETDARTRAGDQTSASNDQRDSARPWTRIAQTSGAERRDLQAIDDADTAQRVMNSQVPVAEAGRALVEDRLANGRDTLRGMQTQAGRDSADAELVRTAMRRNLGPGGATTNISNAYQVTLTNGDNSARASGVALDRANAARPANAPDGQTFIADVASTRLDLARYWTGTTETRTLALGDAARTDAPARLDLAGGHIAKANEGRLQLTPGSPARVEIAAGVVREQSSLAMARSDYRPGESRNLLRDAEAIADTDLANDPRRLGEARGQIGNAGITSVVRSDGRFLPLVRGGAWDETAPDDMRNQSRRLLGRSDLPDNETVRGGRALLRRFDENLAQFPVALRRAGRQFQNGYDLAASQAGVMSRAEGQAGSVKMSSLITGAVWVVSLGNVDMKDSVQGWAEDGAQTLRNQNQGYTNEQRRGANDLATGFERAEAAGHGLQYLNAYRMLGLSNMGEIRLPQATFERNRDFMKGYFAPRRAETREWAAFQSVAFPSNPNLGEGSPVARAMTGPVLSFSDSVQALGDERLAVITQNQQFMLNVGKQRMDDARENMWWYVGINAVGEIGLALVTMGATAPGAVGGVADAANAGRIGLEAAATARTVGTVARIAEGIATFRAAHPILHAGAVAITVGGTVAGANHLTRKAFGDSGVTNFVAVASNFIPVGAGAKVSQLGSQGRRVALIGEEGLSLSRGVSWSAIREGLSMSQLVGHARFYGPQFAMAGVQVGGSIVAVPWAARKLGLERSEFAQAAMNVVLGAVVTSGFAAGMHRMNRTQASNATAERLVEGLGSVREGQIPDAQRTQMTQAAYREIDAFQRNTHNRMPTVEEVAGLRTRLAERLGVDPNTQSGRGQMQIIEGAVEGMRVQRAGELGLQQAIREERTGPNASNRERVGAMITPDEFHPGRPPTRDVVQRAVELAGERLYQARGGAEGGASRLQAYRDAAQQIAGTFHAQALHQVQNHGRSQFSEALVRAETYAGDRVSAVEITTRLQTPGPNGQPPVIGSREAARLEPFLAGEINRARAVLEQTPANGNMREHWNNLRQRLIDEVGLSPTAADSTLRTMQADLFQQTSVRRVVGAQVAAGEARPLSNAEIMNQARDTAQRMGFSRDASEVLARDMAQSRPQLEEAGFIRRGGETREEGAFRRFRQQNPEVADRFLELSPDQFVRAFGEAPNPERLNVLANDPQFRALAVSNPEATNRIMMMGPEPNLVPPAANSLVSARAELASLRPGQRLSDASADVILQDVVGAARASLLEDHRQQRPANANMTAQTAFSCGEMGGWCGFGQALTHTRLTELGLNANNLHARQALDIFGRDSFNHAFLVVEMPNGKLYLVDTTFRQFFDGSTGQNNIGRPGQLMRQSERGSRIADQLLERGFVELTPAVAQEYGRALSGNPNATFTVADYMNARRLPLDFTRGEMPNLAAVPPMDWGPGVASAGRPVQFNPAEQVHVGVGDFRGNRFTGGGHEYTNIAALEAQGYQRTDRATLISYRDAVVQHRRARQAYQAWQRADRATRGPNPGNPGAQEPQPGAFGLTSDRVYFVERNGNAWVGGIFPAGNAIHHDGHTWFPSNWDQGHMQQAANLLAREGPTVERTNQPSVVKLSAWMRLGQDGRVELAPAGLADPVAQGYLRVGMLVPTDPAAGRTVFAEMRQR